MANTYVLISSQTLGSNQTSVTFSSIPQTYTDLMLSVSSRTNFAGSLIDSLNLSFNSDSANNYSNTIAYGDGASGYSIKANANSWAYIWTYRDISGATATANSFNNMEIYIPLYTANQNKPLSISSASENNATSSGAFLNANAALWRNTAAITSIVLKPYSSTSNSFITGSSFYLYGIKSS